MMNSDLSRLRAVSNNSQSRDRASIQSAGNAAAAKSPPVKDASEAQQS